MEYTETLDRALAAVPERNEAESRLQIPAPEGETDGAFTRLTNIAQIADAVGRPVDHLHRNIQRELGTNGQLEESHARYNGSFSVADFRGCDRPVRRRVRRLLGVWAARHPTRERGWRGHAPL
jgi:translation initiation factor 2 subunit beta (aeIF-2b)